MIGRKIVKLVKIGLSIFALLIILVSQSAIVAPTNSDTLNDSAYIYPILLVISFVYLHLTFKSFAIPLNDFPENLKSELEKSGIHYYKTHFFNETILLGYLVLVFYLLDYLSYAYYFFGPKLEESFAEMVIFNPLIGLFFLIVGITSKARGVMLRLLDKQKMWAEPVEKASKVSPVA